MLSPTRYFSTDPNQQSIAVELYEQAVHLPIVSPHGHIHPLLFSDPNYRFPNPTELFIIPDHYVLRLIHSQGISYERLGVPRQKEGWVETDPRKIWQIFCDYFYLFRATPTGLWLIHEFEDLFGVINKLNSGNAQDIFDQVAEKLASPDFTPRWLYKLFGVEVLTTTDAATDAFDHHRAIQASGWSGRILPTFRPDAVVKLDSPGWCDQIVQLSTVSGIDVLDYASYIRALEQRREFFISMGATATDHGVVCADTTPLTSREATTIFQHALNSSVTSLEAARFSAHMLVEMARMSADDGLVMQLHIGALRNHDEALYDLFGSDRGADFPIPCEFTNSLRPLLNRFGNHPGFTLILFTLDETVYSRELAPLAGYYPAVRLGAPWWFHDSINGMRRYFDQVMETCGIYNTVGFNDDTRAFPSLPARHDLWRRVSANWLAGLVTRGIIDLEDAHDMSVDLAYNLAHKAYRL